MLIRFSVGNFRSVNEPVELTFVAVDEDRDVVRPHPHIGVGLLPAAGILGPNASGKTNVLRALQWLCDAVRGSVTRWDDEIPVQPFAFGDPGDEGPSETTFTVELAIDGIRYEYLLDLDSKRVAYEALFHYPHRRRSLVFERDGGTLRLQRGLGALSGTRALLTDRVLALSIMRRFDEPTTSACGQALRRITSLGRSLNLELLPHPVSPRMTSQFWAEASPELRRRALALLRLADLGVEDVELVREPDLTDSSPGKQLPLPDLEPTRRRRVLRSRYGGPELRLVHRAGQERATLALSEESAGTQGWLRLIAPVLGALDTGALVLFDEIDASLHPVLTLELLRLFQDQDSNPNGAQLLFTTHDTGLLNHLGRDEVWLTQRRPDGSTELGALSDFAGRAVRRSANLEKGYLEGRFGALPDTHRPDLLRELGLTG
ncbi:ATP-binding protein [Actinomyces sp. 2119]|uniref:ATP-binding protein n=1 Tax=Actinomyces lilanjuaniae TaxID=2321394 RepID=A0ABN5PQI2_9ACTO|nr:MULTISPECIES: ATP-binding protein [Actinomyces]AYD90554.1 ATP-binding protein [Actinomyces lilanjuaniae]RJF43994.1 ATP-binding protein [Actinomyces sp. 2119]